MSVLFMKAYRYAIIASLLAIIPYVNIFVMGGESPFAFIGLPSLPWAIIYFIIDYRQSPVQEKKKHMRVALFSLPVYIVTTYFISLLSKYSLTVIGYPWIGAKAVTLFWGVMNFPISLITHWSFWFGAA